MTAREASARYWMARGAAEEQKLSPIEFFHTTSEMVHVSLLGDDDGDISLGIGQAHFFMADWDTTEIDLPEKAAQLAAIRGIASAITDAANILEAELYVEPFFADYRAAK
jgi:hypothetical protein